MKIAMKSSSEFWLSKNQLIFCKMLGDLLMKRETSMRLTMSIENCKIVAKDFRSKFKTLNGLK